MPPVIDTLGVRGAVFVILQPVGAKMWKKLTLAGAILFAGATSTLAATFSFEFVMPATEFSFSTGSLQTSGPQVGVTSTLELVVRNGSSASTNQSYTGNDFVAARLTSVSDSAFVALTSFLPVGVLGAGTWQFISTDGSGVATLSLPTTAGSNDFVVFGDQASELIQLAVSSTPGFGTFRYYLSANRDQPLGSGFLGAGVRLPLTIVGSNGTDVSADFPELLPVPLPASGLLLIGALGGILSMKKARQKYWS